MSPTMDIRLCKNDLSFGPIADGRFFDFTYTFELSILSILPSCFLIVLALERIYTLSRSPGCLPSLNTSSVSSRVFYGLKMVSALAFAATNLAALVLWGTNDLASTLTKTGTAAVALAFVASLCALVLSHFEHFRTTRSSLLLPMYLGATLLTDSARIRTFAITGMLKSGFFKAFVATFATRGWMLAMENVEKGWIIREMGDSQVLSPESTASFFSRVLFAWATPLLIRGSRSKLTLENLDPISPSLDAETLYDRGIVTWEKERARHAESKTKHPLVWTLVKAFPEAIFAPIIPCIIYSLAQIATPVAIQDAITFMTSYSDPAQVDLPVQEGWGLAAAFFLIYASYGVAYSWWLLSVNRGAAMLRGYLVEAIYRKALKVHVEVTKDTGSGKAGSMMSLETEKILLRFENVYAILNAVIVVVIGLVILYRQIGISFISTVITVIVLFAITPPLSKKVGPAQATWSSETDKRQKLTGSVLRNILPVKLSAYAQELGERIREARTKELAAYRTFWLQLSKMIVVTNVGSSIIGLVTLVTYATVSTLDKSVPPLDTTRMFTVVATLNIVSNPFMHLGQGWASLVGAWVSIKRIEEFLLAEEKMDRFSPPTAIGSETGKDIVFQDASFGRGDLLFLKNLNTSIPHGKLTFLIGRVGCGKSTFLHACLGESDLLSGSISVPPSKSAYCCQDTWLRSESIRKAILFASDLDELWYQTVLKATQLDKDIALLPDGDQTMVTGISGGQRQRVALARAIYSEPETLYLDDCFSALDANTESAVFDALFKAEGLLSGKTVLLVTNGIHQLEQAENIIMLADGAISEQGSYATLMANAGPTRDLVRDFVFEKRNQSDSKESASEGDSEKAEDLEIQKEKDLEDEGRRGGVSWRTYRFYCQGVGPFRCVVFVSLCLVMAGLPIVTNVYRQYWSEAVGMNVVHGLKRFIGGYIALEFALFLITGLDIYYTTCVAAKEGSAYLHERLLRGVLNAPLNALTPVGKVLNRFSQDVFLVDFDLPLAIVNLVTNAISVMGSLLTIIAASPYVGLIIVGVGVFFIVVTRFYGQTSQQIRRLDLGSKTPLYALLTDTVDADGIRTLRAFKSERFFRSLNTTRVRASQKPYYLMNVARRWLNNSINLSVAFINTALIILAVTQRHSTNVGIFAVALVQATTLTMYLNQVFISWVETEIAVVAVERIKEYADLVPEDDSAKGSGSDEEDLKLREVWPRQGGIIFDNVTAKYDVESEPVLKNLSFKIRAGDRVGICGRTGSGKSSTLAALFRLIKPEKGGRIIVDGKDTCELPLDTLRSGMTLIPQDPLLLEMSIRDNLDIEGHRSDAEIWEALDKCSLKAVIESMPSKLDEVVSGSGRFSRGQKQLLALTRALLRNRTILCLDEATSSIDVETDQAVQKTLRSAFGGATIISVAHRVSTLKDYDLVMVLDNGRLAEQGSPRELLKLSGGLFRRLVMGDEVDNGEVESGGGADIVEVL